MDEIFKKLVPFIIVLSPIFIWVIRVEVRLTGIYKDVKFLKNMILKWNQRKT